VTDQFPVPGTAPEATTAAGRPRAGWYPDPWVAGQHRYWTGDVWTAHVFPDGPAHQGPDPAPWSDHEPEAIFPAEVSPGSTTPARSPKGRALAAAALVVGLIVGFVAVVAIVSALTGRTSSRTAAESQPPPVATFPPETTPPTLPPDPGRSALSGLVLGQTDVASTVTVQPLPGGDAVIGQATLDLCNGAFPSEQLRTARLQVAAVDAQGNTPISTEAVLYSNPAAAAQAFGELKAIAANCPATPVPSPVGEPTVTTHFNAAPDGAWPQTPTVERAAFDFTTTDAAGQSQHSVAVYLRRGRVLMGVYFLQPGDSPIAVGGQTSAEGIVNLFAGRMAALAASVVNAN
jgi:hypothetical protein